MKARIEAKSCLGRGCPSCAAAKDCQIRALVYLEPGSPAMIQETTCNGCGDCIAACLAGAIVLKP